MNIIQGYPNPQKDYYKVYVNSITYNQAPYIEDNLNGVAIQETNFPFVHHVIDDASTDGEQDVIKAWMEKNCDMEHAGYYDNDICTITIVKNKKNPNCTLAAYLLKKNLWKEPKKKGTLIMPWQEGCPYEALCEGDDYWIDPKKLQKQVDWLDQHKDCSCCVTDYKEYYQNEGVFKNPQLKCLRGCKDVGLTFGIDYYSKCEFFTKTPTCMYRLKSYNSSKIKLYDTSFDMVLFYALATQGSIHIINEKMGVYRINDGSTVSAQNVDKFNKQILPKLFSICREENTHYARKFVYNYQKSHVLQMLLWNKTVVTDWLRYLGVYYTIRLFAIDLTGILIDIIKSKIKR